jgi:hypothetical protein
MGVWCGGSALLYIGLEAASNNPQPTLEPKKSLGTDIDEI